MTNASGRYDDTDVHGAWLFAAHISHHCRPFMQNCGPAHIAYYVTWFTFGPKHSLGESYLHCSYCRQRLGCFFIHSMCSWQSLLCHPVDLTVIFWQQKLFNLNNSTRNAPWALLQCVKTLRNGNEGASSVKCEHGSTFYSAVSYPNQHRLASAYRCEPP